MRQRGFTLLELMVAVAVFAVVSAVAYGGLSSVLKTRQQIEQHAQRLQALQQTLSIMERDLVQAVARPVRDPFGTLQPAMYQAGEQFLLFTRDGRPNLQGRRQSHLRRIGYAVDDGHLVRYLWPVLDAPAGTEPYRVPLLEGVVEVTSRFLDSSRVWHDSWPPTDSDQPAADVPLPLAIEFVFELERWGTIRRLLPLVEMPAGNPPGATAAPPDGGGQG